MQISFRESETQQLLRESVSRLLAAEYGFERRRKIMAEDAGCSPTMWSTFADLGLLGIGIDERFGGSGNGFGELAVVLEEFGRALVLEPYIPTVVIGAGLVAAEGNERQKAEILPAVVEGRLKLAFANAEPASGYSSFHIETTAVREGSDYLINGCKAVVPGGEIADRLLITARSSGGMRDRQGISIFLVPKGAAGLRIRKCVTMAGTGAAEITLDQVRVPVGALIGGEGGGAAAVGHALERGIAAQCHQSVGAMAALNALTLGYLKIRHQFGQPIGKFQVLQHRMADMAMACELARSMAQMAAGAVDEADENLRARLLSAAKVRVAASARSVGRGAIQLHGGIGLTMEYSAGHYFRYLSETELAFGDIDHHLARFAASPSFAAEARA